MTTVVITGFMGTGKSSVGRALAQRLGVRFVDTDTLVEEREGRSVADIFAADGEPYFRAAERKAIEAALAEPRAVVATGGGAIVDRQNLDKLKAAAPLVCLTARADVIEARVRAEGSTRPLLADPDPRRRIEELLAQRQSAYDQADLRVDTSDRDLDDIVGQIAAFLETT
jgi:shikimate kinase